MEQADVVAVIPILDNGDIVFVEQYRTAIDDWTIELPAGHLEAGEDWLAAGKRELREETGYVAEQWERLGEFYPALGLTNEKVTYCRATGLKAGSLQPASNEDIRVLVVTRSQLHEWLLTGHIRDGKSLVALYAWLALEGREHNGG